MEVLSYRPDPAEFAWTFGGVPPVRRVRPGSILELGTEAAFGGTVRGPDDLVSRVVEFPFVNPQTGPFYLEGAEPGDTLAIHFVSIEPSRDWAASTTIPLFGSLTGTHATALLQEPLEEVVWIYEVDRARRTVSFRARRGDLVVELPLDPMHGTVGGAPAPFAGRPPLVPLRAPPRRPGRRAAAGPDARHRRGRPGRLRGPLLAGPRRPRRQHGHPRDAGRGHLLPGRERRGGAVLDRRRPLPPGGGRELRGGRGGGDGHGHRRRPGQGGG